MSCKSCFSSILARIRCLLTPPIPPEQNDEPLQGAFDLFVKTKQEDLCVKYVERKFADAGIALNDMQLDVVRDYIRDRDKPLNIPFEDSQEAEVQRANGIDWNDENDEIFLSLEEEFETSAKKFMLECPPQIASSMLETMRKNFRGRFRQAESTRLAFEKELLEEWDAPILLLEALFHIAMERGDAFNARNSEASGNEYVFYVLVRLQARACQITAEIIALLRGGYADGAHARWRSLHEVAVTAMFINNSGNEIARRYIAHEVVQCYKNMLACKEHENELNLEPVSDEEFNSLRTRYENAIKEFGVGFEKDYGWAIGALEGRNPNFANIEKVAQMDRMRPYYKLASQNVHSHSRAIIFKLGLPEDSDFILAGPSMYGLDEAGEGAALSLMQATTTLLLSKPSFQNIVECHVIKMLYEETANSFVEVRCLHDFQGA